MAINMKVLLYNINLFTVFVSHYYMQAFSLGTFISLVISLAANNSIVLPETSALENISVNINILGGNFLQRSVNIFGGIFVALSIIGIIHCVVWLVLHFLNIGYINNKWSCFGRIVSWLYTL